MKRQQSLRACPEEGKGGSGQHVCHQSTLNRLSIEMRRTEQRAGDPLLAFLSVCLGNSCCDETFCLLCREHHKRRGRYPALRFLQNSLHPAGAR
jgi:hypothetical protein